MIIILSALVFAVWLLVTGVRLLAPSQALSVQVVGGVMLVWGATLGWEVGWAVWAWLSTFSLCVRC